MSNNFSCQLILHQTAPTREVRKSSSNQKRFTSWKSYKSRKSRFRRLTNGYVNKQQETTGELLPGCVNMLLGVLLQRCEEL